MPVSWSPAKVALVASLDLALSAVPGLLLPLSGAQRASSGSFDAAVNYNELARRAAACSAANALAGVVVAYVRPRALCPCHALSIADSLSEAANGVIGGVVATLLLTGVASLGLGLVSGPLEPLQDTSDEWPALLLLPELCSRDRICVQLSAILLLVSHTFLPLVVATKSCSSALWRVVFGLDVRGPLEATVLAGTHPLALHFLTPCAVTIDTTSWLILTQVYCHTISRIFGSGTTVDC